MKVKIAIGALVFALLFAGAAFAQKAPLYPQGIGCYLMASGVDLHKQSEEFIRGDYNCDGALLTNDPLMELQYIFGVPGSTPPSCEDAADYDDDGSVLTNDPLMALQFIFGVPGSSAPPPPYPDCGPDPTGDDLDCVWHEFCMGPKK